MTSENSPIIINALEELKAKDIVQLDVRELSQIMDTLIIATGTSSRHVKSLANSVVVELKQQGYPPLGVEGVDGGEWVLVDFGDTVVHVMQQQTRDFYELEKLWSMEPGTRYET